MNRSLGALMLARTGATDEEIAKRCRVSRVAVSYWKNGKKKPSKAKRKLLAKFYDLAVASWDQDPPGESGEQHVDPPAIDFIVDDKFDELSRMANELLVFVRTDKKATPLEKAKVMGSIATTLKSIDARQAGLEKRLLHTPRWKRIEKTILGVLRQFPDAMTAVLQALEQLNDETEQREIPAA